jgi:hypothetical protein
MALVLPVYPARDFGTSRWQLGTELYIKFRGSEREPLCPLMADIVAKVGEGRLGRNNRIATSKSLNQPCVSRADLESMLLPRTPKIFLQQNRPISGMTAR